MKTENRLMKFVSIVFLTATAAASCALSGGESNLSFAVQTANSNQEGARNNNSRGEAKETAPAESSDQAPKIVSRREWQAKDAIGKTIRHEIKAITIHHTAAAQKKNVDVKRKMQNLQNFSQSESRLADGGKKPAWADVPYHFYIDANGAIAEGRAINLVGDTNTDYDPTGHALVVLEGNFETETPSPEQLAAAETLLRWLAAKYKVPTAAVKGHNDYASTACPGAKFKESLTNLQQKIGAPDSSVSDRRDARKEIN